MVQVRIASYRVRTGAEISVRPRSADLGSITRSLAAPRLPLPPWLERDDSAAVLRVTGSPLGVPATFDLDLQLVVEYYARFL